MNFKGGVPHEGGPIIIDSAAPAKRREAKLPPACGEAGGLGTDDRQGYGRLECGGGSRLRRTRVFGGMDPGGKLPDRPDRYGTGGNVGFAGYKPWRPARGSGNRPAVSGNRPPEADGVFLGGISPGRRNDPGADPYRRGRLACLG
ncbi:hypothetical protein D1872_280270 [compost metagenome]